MEWSGVDDFGAREWCTRWGRASLHTNTIQTRLNSSVLRRSPPMKSTARVIFCLGEALRLSENACSWRVCDLDGSCRKAKNAAFNETFLIHDSQHRYVVFNLMDKDSLSADDVLGQCAVDLKLIGAVPKTCYLPMAPNCTAGSSTLFTHTHTRVLEARLEAQLRQRRAFLHWLW